jgi:hypothetical protein
MRTVALRTTAIWLDVFDGPLQTGEIADKA